MEDNINDLMNEAGYGTVGEEAQTEQPKPQETAETTQDEKPVTETKEEVNTENKEDVQANSEENKPESKSTEFDINSFNKAFEKEFKDVDEIKSLFGLSDEYSAIKAQLDERDKQLVEKDEALKKHFNPLEYFANEQQFKANQILKENPDLNETVVNKLVTSNLDELDDRDVLKLNELLTTKGNYDESLLNDVINDKYGLEGDKEDMTDEELRKYQVKEYMMQKDAQKARDDLKKVSNVEIPEFKDPVQLSKEQEAEAQKQFDERKAKWSTFTEKMVKDMKSLPIEYKTDGKETQKFEFAYDDQFKAVLKEKLPEIAAKSNIDMDNDKQVNALMEQVNKDYWWLRRSEAIKTAVDDVMTKMTKEQIDKYYNTSKPKQSEAPESLSDEDRHNQAQLDQMMDDIVKR